MKKTGKVLSLVLSAALVVSSLTATFASAATASETGTVSLNQDTVYLSNGGSNAGSSTSLSANLIDYLKPDASAATIKLNDNTEVTGSMSLKDVVVSSGSSIASVKNTKDNGTVNDAELTLSSNSVSGTVTVAARYEGSIYRGTNTSATTVYASANLTVDVLKQNGIYVLKAGGAVAGKKPDALDSMKKSGSDVEGSIYKVNYDAAANSGNGSALATWSEQPFAVGTPTVAQVNAGTVIGVTTSGNTSVKLTQSTTSSNSFSLLSVPTGSSGSPWTQYASIGSVTVTAQTNKVSGSQVVQDGSTYTQKATASAKVANEVEPNATNATNPTISSYGGVTYLYNSAIASSSDLNTAKGTGSHLQVVTGCDIDLPANATMASGTVGTVNTKGNQLTVNGGSVAAATTDTKNTGSVVITKGSVNNVGTADKPIKSLIVNGGSVATVYANGITLESNEAGVPITAGSLYLKVKDSSDTPSLSIKSEDYSTIKTGAIKVVDSQSNSGTITLDGDELTVGQIDANYTNTTISLINFKGTLAAPLNAYTQGVDNNYRGITVETTQDNANETAATITGTAVVPTLNVTSGTVNFPGSVTIGQGGVNGSGTLEFVPGKLYAQGSISGVNMKLTSAFKAGDTAFTADTGVVDANAFTPVGFTLSSSTSNSKDTFKIATTVFAGLQISGPATIVQKNSATYTAAAYPDGTSLPAGDSIAWSFDGNTDSFTFTSNGNSATVVANKYDSTFTSVNKGTLTAKVVDANGDEVSDYPAATYDVSILAAATQTYTSDTHVNVSVALDGTYTYKITSLDGKEHAITNGSNSFKVTKAGQSGNAYFYTITPAGKVGDACGIYVDGQRLDVATIVAAKAKIDTAKVTKAVGATYQFKVTAPTKPTFGLGSSAVKVIASSNKGNDYFFKVKVLSGKTGDGIGVYVNGVRMSILTIG